jgi:hypothetical protein
VRGAIAAVAVVPALVVGVGAAAQAHRAAPHRTEAAIGDYVQDRAARGDTQYVLYARADVGYYTGLPSPYPYAWSLMVRAIPGARARLRRTLAGPARPTWVIRWQSPRRWGLDPGGALARLLRREYRPVATFGGHQVLLRRGVSRPGHNRRRCPRPTRTAGAASTAATRTRPTGRRPRWSCSTT